MHVMNDTSKIIMTEAGSVIQVVLSFEAAVRGGAVVHSVSWQIDRGLQVLLSTLRGAEAIAVIYVERSGIHRILCRMKFADKSYQERRVAVMAEAEPRF